MSVMSATKERPAASLPAAAQSMDGWAEAGPSNISSPRNVPPPTRSSGSILDPLKSRNPEDAIRSLSANTPGAAGEEELIRVRKFHRRSRKGCEHCKKRRVRCDEKKPVCGNCTKKGSRDLCTYNWLQTSSASSTPRAVNLSRTSISLFSPPPASPAETAGRVPQKRSLPKSDGPLEPIVCPPQAVHENAEPRTTGTVETFTAATPLFDWKANPLRLPLQSPPDSFGPDGWSNLFPANPCLLPSADVGHASLWAGSSDASGQISHMDIPHSGRNDPPLSPDTESMFATLFGGLPTPPIPPLLWGSNTDGEEEGDERAFLELGQDWLDSVAMTRVPLAGVSQMWLKPSLVDLSARQEDRWTGFVNTLTRQTQIVQQPNELAMYFPTIEQRAQFCHFFHETSNDLVVIPVTRAANPWIANLSHLALGKAAGHEVLHDAFRYGLLSLASLDMGLKMRQGLRNTGYNAMYESSAEQRDSALKLLHVAKVLRLFETDAAGADLALATVAALAIRDRYAGSQEFEEPLKIAVSLIMDQGGAAAYLAKSPTPGRRFLVEQMACLEILGVFTSWNHPQLLSGDVAWFKDTHLIHASDHVTEVYGWDRDTVLFSAEIMNLADEMKAISTLRSTYRKTSYPAVQAVLEQRLVQLQARYGVLATKATKLRLQTSMTPLHPRAAAGTLLQQACMELMLHGDPEDASWKPILYPKTRAILDLCEESMSRGMYTGLLLPLTWAAATIDPQDVERFKLLLRQLQPHYLVDPTLMQSVIDVDWTQMMDVDVQDWCHFMREKGFYVPFF